MGSGSPRRARAGPARALRRRRARSRRSAARPPGMRPRRTPRGSAPCRRGRPARRAGTAPTGLRRLELGRAPLGRGMPAPPTGPSSRTGNRASRPGPLATALAHQPAAPQPGAARRAVVKGRGELFDEFCPSCPRNLSSSAIIAATCSRNDAFSALNSPNSSDPPMLHNFAPDPETPAQTDRPPNAYAAPASSFGLWS